MKYGGVKVRINTVDLINSLLLVIFCTTRFWGMNLPWYINVFIRIITIIFIIFVNKLKIKVSKKALKIAKMTIIPIILIVVYTCLIWFFYGKIPEIKVIRNLFTSNIYLIIDVIYGILLYSMYKEKCVDMFVHFGFISYIIGSIIPMICKFPSESLLYLLTSYSNNYDLLYFTEVNDLTFGIGFCLLYYMFIDERKDNKINLLKSILLIFWGLKRIEIAAIILCYLFYKVVVSKIDFKNSLILATCIILAVSYVYVLFIHNNSLIDLASEYNINFMGRLPTYTYVANNYSDFSPTFWGIGYGYIDEILTDLENAKFKINNIPIISLHSDILRIYIGIGFFAFGLWIIYQCYIKTTLIKKYAGIICAKAYLIFTIYVYVLYLTDNTYSYPITFVLYFVCTLCSIDDNNNLGTREELNEKRFENLHY